MIVVTQCRSNPSPDANTFAGIMELYENNYIKIRQLCGDLRSMSGYSVCSVENGPTLAVEVVDRSRYTIDLEFYYPAGFHSGDIHLPSFHVRVYFDAHQAEARRTLRLNERFHLAEHSAHPSIGTRWQDNHLLFKWLRFCVKNGYSFAKELSKK